MSVSPTRAAFLAAILAATALPASAGEITVFAAASLKTALDQIAADWQAANPGDTLTISYGGSSALARQITSGAPADLFISASEPWMDEVEKVGLIHGDSRHDLLGNDLVLIAYGENLPAVDGTPDIAAALNGGKLAMALVDSVPAGVYGKQALESLGQWAAVEPHVAQADDVRAALAMVATGAAPFGITYASDSVAEPKVTSVWTFPEDSHDPIVYPAAALSDNADAAAFLAALSAPAAGAVFTANGFSTLAGE